MHDMRWVVRDIKRARLRCFRFRFVEVYSVTYIAQQAEASRRACLQCIKLDPHHKKDSECKDHSSITIAELACTVPAPTADISALSQSAIGLIALRLRERRGRGAGAAEQRAGLRNEERRRGPGGGEGVVPRWIKPPSRA